MARTCEVRSGKLCVSVSSEVGGRLTRLCYDGFDFLTGPDVNPDNFGATFWTSPQSDWGWPPVATVDSEPYTMKVGSGELVLRSQVAEIGPRRFVIEKHVRARPGETIDIEYLIENVGEAEFSMAVWEISRVAPGGLTFFPTGERELSPVPPHGPLLLEKESGISFYDHGKFELGESLKVHADGVGGWLAHVIDGRLLLKTFKDSLPSEQAPGEGEVELFANLDGRYVEVEVQGPYLPIAPGRRSSFVVRTHVCMLPRAALASRQALVDAVSGIVLEVGRA